MKDSFRKEALQHPLTARATIVRLVVAKGVQTLGGGPCPVGTLGRGPFPRWSSDRALHTGGYGRLATRAGRYMSLAVSSVSTVHALRSRSSSQPIRGARIAVGGEQWPVGADRVIFVDLMTGP